MTLAGTDTNAMSSSGDTLGNTQMKNSFTNAEAAGGSLTMQGGTVYGDIIGYAAVSAQNAEFGGSSIRGGKTNDSMTNTSSATVAKTGETSSVITNAGSFGRTAAGKLELNGGTIVNNAAVGEFQTVSFAGVSGIVSCISAGNAASNLSAKTTLINDTTLTAGEGKDTRTFAAAGALTITDGDALSIGTVYGYGKVDVTGGSIGEIVNGGTDKDPQLPKRSPAVGAPPRPGAFRSRMRRSAATSSATPR